MTTAFDSLHFGPGLDIAARSIVGVGAQPRAENQDNYLLIDIDGNAEFLRDQAPQRQHLPGWERGCARIAVLDGMGGHGHGREAAEAVVAGLLATPACASIGELAQHLDALHARLQHEFAGGDEPARRPGTTLTMLELRAGQPPLLYHVGDSRLYQLGPGGVRPLTVDHVPATVLALSGAVGEALWWQQVHGMHHPQIAQAFILGNAFGDPTMLSDGLFELTALNLPSWLARMPDRRALVLNPQSTYLLASDGFWSCGDPYGWVQRWPALLGSCDSARAAVDTLFAEIAAHPPPGLHSDNLTAIVLKPVAQAGNDDTALPQC